MKSSAWLSVLVLGVAAPPLAGEGLRLGFATRVITPDVKAKRDVPSLEA